MQTARPPFRRTSSVRLFGWPLYEIAHGADVFRGRKYSTARALVAVGDYAFGLIAIGGGAFGLVAIGPVAFGLLAVGFMAIGFVAVGVATAGWYAFGP